ncbi:Hypothetical protein PHPALM_5523 [Phytophthora palmivora]|uniref:Uncharacterized protein n=1 Tax=Phytophthora palmivora TaxID=4796 RepID=A0A2P4YHD8_9STRA|nr:Hypothetical protein PHPALM_5523 [Phytophthora palmivora]
MVVNPKELLQQQNTVIGAYRLRRNSGSDLPAVVRASLTVPFLPDEMVPLARPHDLRVVYGRRQHILDCLKGSRKKNTLDIYRDLHASHSSDNSHSSPPLTGELNPPEDSMNTSSDEDTEPIKAVRQQNRTLGKRTRRLDPNGRGSPFIDGSSIIETEYPSEDETECTRGAFRPSVTQQRVHRSIRHARFTATYPSWHFLRFAAACFTSDLVMKVYRSCTVDQLTCGIEHLLKNRTSALLTSRRETAYDRPLLQHHEATCAVRFDTSMSLDYISTIKTLSISSPARSTTDRYRGVSETDPLGWKLMVFWVTTKFSKFRSFIVSRDITAAKLVGGEFSRTDEDLLELLDHRRSRRAREYSGSRPRQNPESIRPVERPRRESSVPTDVLAVLPVQRTKRLCMKSIYQAGCSGNPTLLPDIVKTYIIERYKGLASDCQDL